MLKNKETRNKLAILGLSILRLAIIVAGIFIILTR